MTRVLIASTDLVGSAMAGPAIRAWEMARVLTEAGHDVELLAARLADPPAAPFRVGTASDATVRRAESWADVLIAQGMVTSRYPALIRTRKRLVIDLYDPYPLEALEAFAANPMSDRLAQHWPGVASLIVQLRSADFFVCSNERQRDLWLGMMLAVGRINPETHAQDHLMRRLLETAPFGIPAESPKQASEPVARGRLPSIDGDSRLALWAGGVYNWFDPLSLIRAWPRVLEEVPSARLLFMGLRHPNPTTPEMSVAREALREAGDLGLRDRGIVFNTGWVPYEQRQAYLCEADIGVSTHFEHLETRYSFRTRYLDYIWAGLPIVATDGDVMADWIRRTGAGAVVPFTDPEAIARAVAGLLGSEDRRRAAATAVRQAQGDLRWERTLEPVLSYCAEPWAAHDLIVEGGGRRQAGPDLIAMSSEDLTPPSSLPSRLFWYARREGPLALAARVIRKLRRLGRRRLGR